MTPHRPQQLQQAYTAGRHASLQQGSVPGRVESPEVEAKLDKLFALSVGMFVAAVTAVAGVGIWLF